MHKKVSHKIEAISDLIGRLPENIDFSQPLDPDKLFGAEPEYPDEIDQVILLLKKMSVELHENIENNITMMKNAEKLKLQLLQLKINPHFLYNILESIKTSQSIGRVEIANEMISKLAKFYRLSLRKGDELITIHDDLEISRLYLDIEKLCREDYLFYEIQCDEGVEEFLIPKFTLQPLLENCVLHAVVPSRGRLQISISIRFMEENILIAIRDNGQGISSHILKELNEVLMSKSVDVKKFYGISNVNARLAYYSDRESALEISSIPDVGTTVMIWLQQLI
jgi:two-component system sensor histidine kinase YesM